MPLLGIKPGSYRHKSNALTTTTDNSLMQLSETENKPDAMRNLLRPPDKSVYLKIIFLISQPKRMLWVLKRTVSMRRFF